MIIDTVTRLPSIDMDCCSITKRDGYIDVTCPLEALYGHEDARQTVDALEKELQHFGKLCFCDMKTSRDPREAVITFFIEE